MGLITITSSVSPGSTSVSAASGSYTFQTGGIATGTLAESGAGTLILLNANTYTGAYRRHFRHVCESV